MILVLPVGRMSTNEGSTPKNKPTIYTVEQRFVQKIPVLRIRIKIIRIQDFAFSDPDPN